jgi:hypothetical protein
VDHALLSARQELFVRTSTLPGRLAPDVAIHRYDITENYRACARCHERAEFHLGRARRAKDRGRLQTAAREIERALRYDDSSEVYFQLLARCQVGGRAPLTPHRFNFEVGLAGV